mmetsp:Transcript_7521/g.6831  ORF Transcript_7521/g.6831 Transcript_7521/m.6831 type:complete len:89 (+) Transcript_7521:1528-1794(+)
MAISRIAREILEKKRAMIALNIILSIKNMNARKIQKRARKILYRPLIHKIKTYETTKTDLEFKFYEKFYHAVNSMALVHKKHKEKKAC